MKKTALKNKASLFLLLAFFSCSQNPDTLNGLDESSSLQLEADYLNPIGVDSFLVDKNSGMFYSKIPHLDRDLYDRNTVFVTNKQNVAIGQIDSLGSFIQHITERGNGPGQIIASRSAKAWQSLDGGIYILTNANVFMLYVYDQKGSFRYSLRLFESLPDYFHPKGSSFHISEKQDGKFYLTIAINTVLANVFESQYHDKKTAIAQFEINEFQQKIVSVKTYFPYENLPEVKKSLKSKKVPWYGSDAKFEVIDDKVYVTFSFSNDVYILNREFEVEKRITVKSLKELRKEGISIDLEAKKPENLYERTYAQFTTYLTNLHVTHIQVLDNLIILQFELPLQENQFLSKFPSRKQAENLLNYQGFFQKRDKYWVVYNMNNNNEELYRLSKDHGRGVFLDKKRMLVEKSIKDDEDQYLVKYTLEKTIGR